jgi:hypothetical protein
MLCLSAPLCNVLASLLDPSFIGTEQYPIAAALSDPDCATHIFYEFCQRPTTPRWACMRVFEAYAASAMALRDPGGLIALALPSRTA